MTKLGTFCDKLIEAGWLAVVAVVPLFFNLYSNSIFQLHKVTLLRSIALVMALAWFISVIESRSLGRLIPWRNAALGHLSGTHLLVGAALAVGAVHVLSTATSIVPHISLWGSYLRLQGTYTTVCYIVVFLFILHRLRTQDQLARLLSVIMITSLPVSLYGIAQHYGHDPVRWFVLDVTDRPTSTVGNPIFLAAYLVMAAFVTLSQLIDELRAMATTKGQAGFHIARVGCYLFLLASQLLCILFTKSRGPWLGLMGGSFAFLLLLAGLRRSRRFVFAAIGVALGVGLFLVWLSVRAAHLAPLGESSYLRRLATILDLESGTARQRVLIWQGTVNLITANPVRASIGYGPESMSIAFNPYWPAELAPMVGNMAFDRAHNEILDTLVSTGFIGLAAHLVLFGAAFYCGLKAVGVIRSTAQVRSFAGLMLLGGTLGVLAPWLLEGSWRFSAIGLAVGMVFALATYVLGHVLSSGDSANGVRLASILPIALLSAIVAHFIEVQFGLAVPSSRTYFWVYLALLAILCRGRESESANGTSHRKLKRGPTGSLGTSVRVHQRLPPAPERASQLRPGMSNGWTLVGPASASRFWLLGLILATAGFGLISNLISLESRVHAWLLFLASWVFGSLLILLGTRQVYTSQRSQTGGFVQPLIYPLFALGWSFMPIRTILSTVQPGRNEATAIVIYYVYLLLTMIGLAATLPRGPTRPTVPWRKRNWWLHLIALLGIIWILLATNLNLARADIYYAKATAHADAGQVDQSISLFQRALELAPHQDLYRTSLAGAYMLRAGTSADANQGVHWLTEAQVTLEETARRSPLDPEPLAKLGLTHRLWGAMEKDPAERRARWEQALEYYRQASGLSPHNFKMFNLWGEVYHAMGNYKEAIRKYKRALSLNPESIQAYLLLADAYLALGETEQGIRAYQKAIELDSDEMAQEKQWAILVSLRDAASRLRFVLK